MAATVFSVPHHTTALKPAFAAPAPMRPPISACELEEGNKKAMKLKNAAQTTATLGDKEKPDR
jgi:hypothetical protein